MSSKNIFGFFLFFSTFLLFSSAQPSGSKKQLILITASYNNACWTVQYFEALAKQSYKDWLLIYIDDNSTDSTYALVNQLIKDHHLESQVILIENEMRVGHLFNQYHAIHACDPDSIIVIYDGDDWFASPNALETIYNAYQDENVWLTYGQFWYFNKNRKGFCKPIPQDIIEENGIRDISWRTSHPRTFYAGLFQQIKLEDLLYHNRYYPKCADVATMFPMIEMAGKHIKFISDILYIYNDANPISYHHDPTEQRKIEAYLRELPRYQPLKEKAW